MKYYQQSFVQDVEEWSSSRALSLRYFLWRYCSRVVPTLELRPSGGSTEATSKEGFPSFHNKLASFSLLSQDLCLEAPGSKQERACPFLTSFWTGGGEVQKEKKLTSLASGVMQRELVSCSLERVCGDHSRLWTIANLGFPFLIFLSVELLMDQMTDGIWWLLKLLQSPPFSLSLPFRGWLLWSPAQISHPGELPPRPVFLPHLQPFEAVYTELPEWWRVVTN